MIMPEEVWNTLLTFCRLEETVESKEICLKYLRNEVHADEFLDLVREYLNKINNKVEE